MFLQNILIAAEQVAILYIMAAIGVICDKTGIYTEKTGKKCTDLLFYVITPAKILESFFTLEYSTETVKGLFIAVGCGLMMHACAALAVSPLFNNRTRLPFTSLPRSTGTADTWGFLLLMPLWEKKAFSTVPPLLFPSRFSILPTAYGL